METSEHRGIISLVLQKRPLLQLTTNSVLSLTSYFNDAGILLDFQAKPERICALYDPQFCLMTFYQSTSNAKLRPEIIINKTYKLSIIFLIKSCKE